MYTILITDQNEMITSQKERIMQRSKLVDTLHFLTSPIYKGIDMTDYTVVIEYILPVSKEYHSETLTRSEELYKEQLEYKVPFDTSLTKEAGDIEIQVTFSNVELDENGNGIQRVRKTSPCNITISPISAWSDIIPDSALTSIDQRIIKTEAMINELEEMNQQLFETYDKKADDLSYEDNKLQLISDGNKIGQPVTIGQSTEEKKDGNIIVVEF